MRELSKKEKTEFNKLQKRLRRNVGNAIADYRMIEPGDRVSSTIYRLVAQKTDPKIQMPPHGEDSVSETKMHPLKPEEVEAIGLWIDQGAKNN